MVSVDTFYPAHRKVFECRQAPTKIYLRGGLFDQDRILEFFEQVVSDNAKGQFPLSRIVCRMDWVVERDWHVDDVVEFESRVTICGAVMTTRSSAPTISENLKERS